MTLTDISVIPGGILTETPPPLYHKGKDRNTTIVAKTGPKIAAITAETEVIGPIGVRKKPEKMTDTVSMIHVGSLYIQLLYYIIYSCQSRYPTMLHPNILYCLAIHYYPL